MQSVQMLLLIIFVEYKPPSLRTEDNFNNTFLHKKLIQYADSSVLKSDANIVKNSNIKKQLQKNIMSSIQAA